MPVMVDNFQDLIDGLDGIAADFANFVVDRECCLANAYAGLNPETGEGLTNVPETEGGGEDIPDQPATDPIGNPILDGQGNPLVCPAYNTADGRDESYTTAVSDFGANIFCVPGFTYAYATAANPAGPPPGYDYTLLNTAPHPDIAIVNGFEFQCPTTQPFDATIEAEYEDKDYFPYIALYCPAVAPDPTVNTNGCPGAENLNGPSTYYALWQQYFCQQETYQKWYIGLYGAQAILGLIAAIEGQQIYNKILDKNLDIICDVKDDIDLVAKCSAQLLGDGTEENPGVLKECQAALLEDHVGRIGVINNRSKFACDNAEDMWECYNDTYQPLEKQYVDGMAEKLYSMICNGEMSSDYLESWALSLESCVGKSMLPSIKQQFAPILDSVGCVSNNLNDWRESVRSKAISLDKHYRNTYQCPEKTMIPAVMEMSTCLAQRVCEMRSWLMACAKNDEDTYNEGYRANESQLARTTMDTGIKAAPHLYETIKWLECNIPAAEHLYQVCYGDGTEQLNPRLFSNAHNLSEEVQCCYRFFRDNAVEYKDFWSNCYKDQECKFVRQQMDVARELLLFSRRSIERLDKWSQEDRNMYTQHFRQLEQEQTKDIVLNGNRASNQLESFGRWWRERAEEFQDVWKTDWKEADRKNIQRHDEVWNETNPLKKLTLNAECMKELSTDAQNAYKHAVTAGISALEKACAEPQTFDYCIEDAAVLHVRKLADIAEEELYRCSSRYCSGATEEARIRLRSEMAKAEGGAYAAAARWKWWANETLQDKAFAQKQAMIQLNASFAEAAISAAGQSSSFYVSALSSMDQAISRGYQYLNLSQESGNRAMQIMTAEVDGMLRMIQLWHFWPEMAVQDQAEAHRMTQQIYNDAQALIGQGHDMLDMSSRDKNSAIRIVESSIDTGVRLTQLGQFHLSQAESMANARVNAAQAAVASAQGSVGQGHELHRLAGSKMQSAMSNSIDGTRAGLQASQIGASIEATALQQENTTTLNALRHMQTGVDALRLGLNYAEEVSQNFTATGNLANVGLNGMLNLFRHGQNTSSFAMSASESCYRQEHEMLCKAKDFAQDNAAMFQGSLHGGTSGTLSNLNRLLSEQGANTAGGFSTFGNALENLLQINAPTPPVPGGQSLFGNGFGAGTGGGLGFGGL